MRIDRLYDVKWRDVKLAAMGWLNQVQYTAPADQVIALAVTFLLICERFKLEPRRVLEASERVLRRAIELEPHYPRAIKAYLREEIPDA